MRPSAAAICGFASLLVALDAPAQTGAAPFVVDRFDTKGGLPQNTVTAVLQARDGYLWVATNGGLARFDGAAFRTMTNATSAMLPSERVSALAQDSAGRIWVGTEGGLARSEGGSFRTVAGLPDAAGTAITSVSASPDGTVWVTVEGAIARVERDSLRLARVSGSLSAPAQSVFALRDSTLVITNARGTFRTNPRDSVLSPTSVAGGRPVEGVLFEDSRGVWYRTAGGLLNERGARVMEYAIRARIGGAAIVSAARDANGIIWLGTGGGGVHRFNPDSSASPAALRQAVALPGEYEQAIAVDREGNVWIGSNSRGLRRIRPALFQVFARAEGLANDVTAATLADRRGRVWVGANCGGVSVIEKGRVRVIAAGFRNNCIWTLAEDREDRIWLGSYGGGVGRWRNERLEWFTTADGVPSNTILSLLAGRDGRVWLGTDQGLAWWDSAGFHTRPGVVNRFVHTLYEARDGALWVGTEGGVSRFAADSVTHFTVSTGLPHNYVRAIHEDSSGAFWFGTYGGGLARLREGKLTNIRASQGLFDNVVSSIIEDRNSNLWMSGNRGVFRASLRDLNAVADGRQPRLHSVAYGTVDGMRSAETNGGFIPAVTRTADGRLWYPTIEGVAVVDPAIAAPSPVPPTVLVERVVVNNEVRDLVGELRVGPGASDVEFGYSGLSLSDPSAVSFRYRLTGWDDEWVDAGARRSAYYSRLGAGTYSFEVAAANRDGVWSAPTPPLELVVLPPFWATWWFQGAIAVALVGSAGSAIRYRVRRVERAHAAQQEFSRQLIAREESERKRIAGELHDSIGQDLLVLKNRATLALGADTDRARTELGEISAIAADAIKHVRQIAQNLRPLQIDRLGLTAALKAAVESVAGGSTMTFTTRFADVDELLEADAAINVYRVLQESLNNVMKHSGATNVHVQVDHDDGVVRLQVLDDGRGFAQGATPYLRDGLGLSGMAERAQILGGTCAVLSEPGDGTRVALTVPVKNRAAMANAATKGVA